MEFHLNLRQLVHALSDALDMVGVDDRHHGKRVAFMARQCARELGVDAAQRDALFVAALLHDCGVSSTQVHLNLVNELDWSGAQDHCHKGYRLLAACEPFADLAGCWKASLHAGFDGKSPAGSDVESPAAQLH